MLTRSGIYAYAAPAPSGAFVGNPNVTVSAVDVATNGIVASRISGTTPCFIQVSASGVLCTGTNSNGNPVLPYEDLMFSFDGGDPSGADTVVSPVNNLGTVVSTNVQVGPEATFCYRNPGPYTITMTVTYQTTPGVYATATSTLSVTVTAWAGTTSYLDTFAPDGGDGTTKATAWNNNTTIATINSFTSGGANRRLSVALGSSYTVTTTNSLKVGGNSVTGGRLDTYADSTYSLGATAKPIFQGVGSNSSGQNSIIIFAATTGVSLAGDNVISNIQVNHDSTGSRGSGIGVINNAFGTFGFNYNYIDTCDVINTNTTVAFSSMGWSGLGSPSGAPIPAIGWGVWKCNLQSQLITGVHGIYSECRNWFFVLGTTIVGAGSSAGFHHHIYPETEQHSLYRWNGFGETGSGGNAQRSYCINMNAGSLGPADGTNTINYTEFHYIADNRFGALTLTTGGQPQYVHDLSSANNEPAWCLYRNVVTERNFCKSLTAGSFLYFNQKSHTIRYNSFYDVGGIFTSNTADEGVTHTQFYNNKIYKPSGTSGNAMPNYFQEGTTTGVAVSLASPAALTMTRTAALPVGSAMTISASTATGLSNGVYYVAAATYVSASSTWSLNISASPTLTPLVNTTGSGTCTVTTAMALMPPQTFTDNIVWDDRTVPAMWTLHTFSDWNSANNKSLIDRNKYYTPNNASPTPFFQGSNSTSYPFTIWQGSPYLLDANGSLSTSSNPGWNPSNCAIGIF